MRTDIAPFGIDLMLAIAGLGILAVAGLLPGRLSSILGALGLAYMTGAAIVPLVLAALLAVGVPLNLPLFTVIVLVCAAIGALRWRPGGAASFSISIRGPLASWRTWPTDTWIVAAFCAIFGGYWVIGLLSTAVMPLNGWDAWSIWARKAEMLTVHNSLIPGFFTSPSYGFTHLDYPLQYPIWEALHFRASGGFHTQMLPRHIWLLLATFVWAAAYLLRNDVRPVIWAPVLLLVSAAPGVWQQLLSGYADVPMAMFIGLGATALGLWLSRDNIGCLAVAAIMLAAAANSKNEGLATVGVLFLMAGAIAVSRRANVRALLVAASAVAVAVLPWRLWIAANGIQGDMPVSKGLQPGYLFDHLERVRPALEAINAQLGDQSRWLYLLPLAAMVVAASLISGIGRRIAAFYLGAFILSWAVFVWSYWISPYNLAWHLSTSVDRVVSAPMFICFVAVIHVSGMLVTTFYRSLKPEGRDSDMQVSTF